MVPLTVPCHQEAGPAFELVLLRAPRLARRGASVGCGLRPNSQHRASSDQLVSGSGRQPERTAILAELKETVVCAGRALRASSRSTRPADRSFDRPVRVPRLHLDVGLRVASAKIPSSSSARAQLPGRYMPAPLASHAAVRSTTSAVMPRGRRAGKRQTGDAGTDDQHPQRHGRWGELALQGSEGALGTRAGFPRSSSNRSKTPAIRRRAARTRRRVGRRIPRRRARSGAHAEASGRPGCVLV